MKSKLRVMVILLIVAVPAWLELSGTALAGDNFFIRDNATGGDCSVLGTWHADTKTCVMLGDADVSNYMGIAMDGIIVADNGITLDGNGHQLLGGGGANGVTVSGRSGVTVKNLSMRFFNQGVYLNNSSGNTISGNIAGDANQNGIYLAASSGNLISGNNASGNYYNGIVLDAGSINNVVRDNTAVGASSPGIYLYGANDNDVVHNHIIPDPNGNGFGFSGLTLQNSSGNRISGNDIAGDGSFTGSGVTLVWSDNNAVAGNSVSFAFGGVSLQGSRNNLVSNNSIGSNAYGVMLQSMDPTGATRTCTGNVIKGNMVSANWITGISIQDSSGNDIYANNFVAGGIPQAQSWGSSVNSFNRPAPIGGNYWSDWTSPDANSDGFVDSPYVFTGGSDLLPRTMLYVPSPARPSLGLTRTAVFWGSYADYLNGDLSVTVALGNAGEEGAYAVRFTGGSNSNGAELQTPMPLSVGRILPGATASATLTYHLPAGVGSFQSMLTASAEDPEGISYTYP
ncbi:MAG: right-handed parallel beta-helix repeat-containing protein [Thermoleophilia bacterium]